MDAAFSPQRQMGIRFMNYLDDCLDDCVSQIRAGTSRSQAATAQPPGASWDENQFSQELVFSQPASCLPGNSYRFGPDVGLDYAGTLSDSSAAIGVIQIWDFSSPLSCPEDALPHISCLLCDSVGPASYALCP